jgi:hypothetical protein
MFRVVAFRQLTVDTQQLQGDEVQAPALETGDHLADEAALHAVGLDQDEGSFEGHGAQV